MVRVNVSAVNRKCADPNRGAAPTGRGPRLGSRRAGLDVVGIDLTASFIARARALHPGLRFEEMDVRALRFGDASIAGVWSMATLLQVATARALLTRADFEVVDIRLDNERERHGPFHRDLNWVQAWARNCVRRLG
ncbi:class I SAM-dependent methyltransferase [Streptomyces sp. RB6PN25]|uniref:Class I SAM-dependent methyltransferase n=1 Tax=Streptomyces humicola TaxID=2953240 RepID=A0ABT1Q3X1_9ACTN|nr:class I SAM-dependent methyltransferase [Streptomyces humicola]MCQ4084600.1 class I SAM-dependent methyltransferase [Streptomyces humicola]